MAATLASRVALAGPSIARNQVVRAPNALLSSSSLGFLLSSNCRILSNVRRWRLFIGHRFVPRSRSFATSAVEDQTSQGELPHSETSKETPQQGLRISSVATSAVEDQTSQGELAHSEASKETPQQVPEAGEPKAEFEDMADIEVEKGFRMSRVCDRLIEVFLVERTKPEDWRILITFSKEWDTIRPYFFKRCESQTKLAADPKKKANLLKLARQMKEVDDDMQRHDKTLDMVRESLVELDAIVARHREDFTGDFFQHLHLLTEACQDDLDRREELATIASKCLIAVEAHDRVSEDDQFLDAAQTKFDEILSSPSLEAAAAKIDNLAKTKQLDSTLMLLMTKAWASAKESTLMKDEAKDIMFYLYNIARANMAKSIPKEIQIIRRLLSIEDPRERFEEMTLAFSPGDDLEGKEKDAVYTKPEKLLKWINVVLDAFYSNKKGTLIKEAQNLLNPSVISRLEILRDVLEEQFL